MRRTLLIVCLSALPVISLAGLKAVATTTFAQQKAVPRSRQAASEIAAITKYCNGLDQYFKNNPKSTRFFVDALPEGNANSSPDDKKEWHEVKTREEMWDAERSYANQSLTVSVKAEEIVYASIGEPMEHSRHDSEYYFRSDGTLAKISSEYQSNAAEMFVSRENFYDSNSKLLQATSQCFRIIYGPNGNNSNKRVSCRAPQMREEIEGYKISVYKRNTDLPGYSTLKKG